jgi:hypothetical protein
MAARACREFHAVAAKELILRVFLEDKATNTGSVDVVTKALLSVGQAKLKTSTNARQRSDGRFDKWRRKTRRAPLAVLSMKLPQNRDHQQGCFERFGSTKRQNKADGGQEGSCCQASVENAGET